MFTYILLKEELIQVYVPSNKMEGKQKYQPPRERVPRLRISCCYALPLSHRESYNKLRQVNREFEKRQRRRRGQCRLKNSKYILPTNLAIL